MPALDWIFAAVLLMSMLIGAWRGLIYEVLSLISWLAAFVLAKWLAQDVAHYLPMSGASEMMRYGAGFVLVFIATVMLGSLIATLVKKLMTTVGLRPVDRVLGASFGLIRGGLLLLLATVLVAMTPFKSTATWQESVGVRLTLTVIKGIKPALPRDLDKFLPTE
jgi:membrane protein required for colicin V production